MQPEPLRFGSSNGSNFGERNSRNTGLHGRGIELLSSKHKGNIYIGHWVDGDYSPGPYFRIFYDYYYRVGELYMKEGERWKRGTQYNPDGTQ